MSKKDNLTSETEEYVKGVLVNYIKYARNLGYNSQEIKKILIDNGHKDELITKALEHAKEEIFDKNSKNNQSEKLEKAEENASNEILKFIKDHLKRGYKITEIEEILKHLGHEEEIIDKAFEKSKINKEEEINKIKQEQKFKEHSKEQKKLSQNKTNIFSNIFKQKKDKNNDLKHVKKKLSKLQFQEKKSNMFKGSIIHIWIVCFVILLCLLISITSQISINLVLKSFLPSILSALIIYFLETSYDVEEKYLFVVPIIFTILISLFNFDKDLSRILRTSILNIIINYIGILISRRKKE